ncbi:hypothetical protein VLK31_05975 [Variovorax sp. H27-G14]|uniref:hypothetical protein n=1 Tax=Variovorax sp. H27-G14 TaxID=3111914 RepID=UPI0038FC3F60
MGGIDVSIIGMFIAVVTGLGSYVLGKRMREKRAAKRREKDRIASQAGETRQVRRARERKERDG